MQTYVKDGVLFFFPGANLVSDTIVELRESFFAGIRNNPENTVVLDAYGIEILDFAGVNLIISLYKELIYSSRKFRIINAHDRFMKVACFFKFPELFPVEREKGAP